jgi:hypothetical protein
MGDKESRVIEMDWKPHPIERTLKSLSSNPTSCKYEISALKNNVEIIKLCMYQIS